jgi:molybdopterin-binding protein
VQVISKSRSFLKEVPMKYGARNAVVGTVKSVNKGDIMSLVKFDVAPCEMASVLTSESLEEMGLRVGDTVSLVVKAVNVLPVKE